MKTYALTTLGCKVNQYEGERMHRLLGNMTNVPFGEPADIYIINTCSVTAEAEAKARQLIGRAKRAAPGAYVVLTGCWPPSEKERLRALGVDLLLDNASKGDLSKHIGGVVAAKNDPRGPAENPLGRSNLENVAQSSGCKADEDRGEGAYVRLRDRTEGEENAADGVFGRASRLINRTRTRAFIKVQDGCDAFCAYCAVPYFRGLLKSRSIDEVVTEIAGLVASGTPEIVLTGIHLGKYGVDLTSGPSLLEDLVVAILSDTDLARLRLSSIEPQEVSDNLLDMMAADARIARHLHIPLQSGSDKTLAAMNRHYTAGEYLDLTSRARRAIPDIGLTADVIVGFPGESDDDFKATLDIIDAAAFSRLHIFKFSARPLTAAAGLAGQVPPIVKKDRAAAAKERADRLSARFTASFVGKEVSVSMERERDGIFTGLTSEYVRVKFDESFNKTVRLITAVGVDADKDVLIVSRGGN